MTEELSLDETRPYARVPAPAAADHRPLGGGSIVEELELINRHVSVDSGLDREELRAQTNTALSLACAGLDALPPPT